MTGGQIDCSLYRLSSLHIYYMYYIIIQKVVVLLFSQAMLYSFAAVSNLLLIVPLVGIFILYSVYRFVKIIFSTNAQLRCSGQWPWFRSFSASLMTWLSATCNQLKKSNLFNLLFVITLNT